MRQYKYDSICEIGCGLGYFTNRLHKELCSNNNEPFPLSFQPSALSFPRVTGIDISQTAIEKAKNLFPEISFIAADLTTENRKPFELSASSFSANFCFDLVVIKEVMWNVCHRLEQFLTNVMKMIKENGFLYVSQSFPEADKWVGQEIIDSPESLKEIMLQHLKPLHICTEVDWNHNGRPLVHFLGKPLRV